MQVQELKLRKNQIYVQCLIEHGRHVAWERYGTSFRDKHGQDCSEFRIYNDIEGVWTTAVKPLLGSVNYVRCQ